MNSNLDLKQIKAKRDGKDTYNKEYYSMQKEVLYQFICLNHSGAKSCLTKHLLTDFREHLKLKSKSVSIDENTFRSILGELKSEGRIGHIGSNSDTWKPIPSIINS